MRRKSVFAKHQAQGTSFGVAMWPLIFPHQRQNWSQKEPALAAFAFVKAAKAPGSSLLTFAFAATFVQLGRRCVGAAGGISHPQREV
jgi:hypothetical protein